MIAALMAAMTLLTFYQVVLRYVFNSGLIWAFEATNYLFAWLVLIGMSYCLRVNTHIGVDMIVRLLSDTARRIVGLVAVALCMLYAGMMTYGAYIYIDKMAMLGAEAEDIPLQRWILGIILPIGFGLLWVRLLPIAFGIFRGRRELLGDEAAAAIRSVPGTLVEAVNEDRRP